MTKQELRAYETVMWGQNDREKAEIRIDRSLDHGIVDPWIEIRAVTVGDLRDRVKERKN